MKRVYIAWCMLLITAGIAGFGSFTVHRSFEELDQQLLSAQILCSQKNYLQALQVTEQANTEFSHKEHLLALFLRRDDLRQLQSKVSALSSYISEEYQHDFLFESQETRTQLAHIRHLFFSLF